MNKTIRQSNFELLRIIALFMVLVFHSNIHTNGIPTLAYVSQNPLISFNIFVVQGISVICVNVFVLLSGWFGIRPKLKAVFKLAYLILFFLLGSYIVSIFLGRASINGNDILTCFLLNDYAWFVKSYICLMIFAPILNSFSQSATRKDFKVFLVAFFIFQSIYGWATNAASFFNYGSSFVSFCGLYLLAQYIRRFQPKWAQLRKLDDLLIYFGIVISSAVFLVALRYFPSLSPYYHTIVGHMYSYSCPIVIIECVFLFLFFSKLSFQNKFVNFVAFSSFSALFVHGNPYIFPYQEKVISFYANDSYPIAFLKVLLLCAEAFVIAIILDQVRKYSWQIIEKWLLKKNQ